MAKIQQRAKVLSRVAALCLTIGLILGLIFTSGSAASAQDLPAPVGEVILTVSGAISVTNGDGVATFDIALLKTLPKHQFATSTIWTEGVATYEGVLLADLLAALGASGQTVVAKALNDYQISLPAAAAKADGPLLAFLSDGTLMSARDKGPLWLVYPFDDVAEYRSEQTYARSIWQLDRIEITN